MHREFSREIPERVDKENPGIGYLEVMFKLKQRLYYVLPRIRHLEETL